MSTRKAVGIDLGTTFSAIAHIDRYGKPQIIPNSETERITPSVIFFDATNVIVGSVAKNNAVDEPEKIVDFVKREMGKPKDQFHRDFGGKVYSAEELSALIIRKLKADAEKYLDQPVTDAVITVPAYFNDAERTATITAGQLAGLNVLQIINEPTAAALAYGLGGKDWDDVIVNLIAEEFDRLHGENPLLDLHSYQELHNRALAAKIQLSSRNNTTIVYHHDGKSVKLTLTRKDFEKRTRHLVEKCKTICEMVMQEAKMKWDKIDKVLLAGGMTRMPMIRAMIAGFSSVPLIDHVNPDEVVARGAAIQGILSILSDEDISGERTVDDSVRRQFSALDGGLIEVTDITSHTLGVVLWDEKQLQEYVFPMIRKMTPVPAVIKNSFGTADANMQRAVVKVVEGESTVPGECTPLGVCDIVLPPYLPKGSPVKLTYQYNANQVLEVDVPAAGNTAKVTIDRNTGLAPQEIEQAASGLDALQVS